jgi:hypothetical protein
LAVAGGAGRIVWRLGPDFSASEELRKSRPIIGQHRAHLNPKGLPGADHLVVYDNGGSGYYKVTNRGTQPATVCWTIEFNDGKKNRGCHSALGAGKETTGSCFSCGGKNAGARSMALTKYEVK